MRTTFGQVKAGRIPAAVGLPSCDPRFTSLVNDAQQRLSDAGRWWGSYKRMRICVTSGCITWPHYVKTVEAVNLCGYGVPIRNGWYEFMETVKAPCLNENTCDRQELLDRGTSPQHTDLTTTSKIRIYPAEASDAGNKVLLQGLDGNQKTIRTLDGSDWVDGEYVTLASPSVTTTYSFYKPGLSGAQKPVTNGRLLVYGVHPTSGAETLIAEWQPAERNPDYRRTYYNALPTCTDNSDCTDTGDGCSATMPSCSNVVAEAIVRLECVPVVVDEDWMLIGNQNGLLHAMRSLQLEVKNDYKMAEQEWRLALRAMRDELTAYSPPERTIINAVPYGTAPVSRVIGGFI